MSEDISLIGTDFSGYIESKKKNSLLSLETETDTLNPIHFVKNLVAWCIWRTLRIFTSFIGLFIRFEQMIITLKTDMLQVFYWGRSNTFGVFLQSVSLFIIIIIGFTFVLGGGVKYALNAPVQNSKAVTVANSGSTSADVLVEAGSLETLVPQERVRFDVETYVVRAGDTVDTIAQKYNDLNADSIRWANNLKPGDSVKAGQELRIPPGKGVMYVVKSGDTLDLIAARHNAAQQAIAEVNWFDSASDIKVGEELFIPNGTMPQPTKAPKPVVYAKASKTVSSVPVVVTGTRFLSWPVQGNAGHLSQCPNPYHMAIDIANAGSPFLIAAAPGRVTYAGWHNSGYAWVVEIDHGNGYSTLYAHQVPNSITVRVGDYVERGQVIGRMGQSGKAFGIHIHFEVSQGGGLSKSKRHLVPPPAYMINSYCGY